MHGREGLSPWSAALACAFALLGGCDQARVGSALVPWFHSVPACEKFIPRPVYGEIPSEVWDAPGVVPIWQISRACFGISIPGPRMVSGRAIPYLEPWPGLGQACVYSDIGGLSCPVGID